MREINGVPESRVVPGIAGHVRAQRELPSPVEDSDESVYVFSMEGVGGADSETGSDVGAERDEAPPHRFPVVRFSDLDAPQQPHRASEADDLNTGGWYCVVKPSRQRPLPWAVQVLTVACSTPDRLRAAWNFARSEQHRRGVDWGVPDEDLAALGEEYIQKVNVMGDDARRATIAWVLQHCCAVHPRSLDPAATANLIKTYELLPPLETDCVLDDDILFHTQFGTLRSSPQYGLEMLLRGAWIPVMRHRDTEWAMGDSEGYRALVTLVDSSGSPEAEPAMEQGIEEAVEALLGTELAIDALL